MAKWETGTGVVVAFRYVGPAAPAPEWHWTAIVVDLDTGHRISALLPPKTAKKNMIVIGDYIRLEYQPGQDAGIKGMFGGKRGLCKNIEILGAQDSKAMGDLSGIDTTDQFDLFISHASEDKDQFVRPLAYSLRDAGLEVWYDEFSLSIGDSIRQSIDHGLATSQLGVIVLSHSFFSRKWPQQELNGLFARMGLGNRRILPVWHCITEEDVRKYSPMIADIIAINSSEGIPAVTETIVRACKK